METTAESQLSDEALVRWCQRSLPDDTRPFSLLVARYQRRVFAVAYRMLRDRQEAEDQTQEIFVKVYRNLKRLDNPATVTSWMYRIATNTCLDVINARERRPPTRSINPPEESGELEIADTQQSTPEVAAEQTEMRRCIERTLAGLEATERAIIVLRDIEGRAYDEIAESLRLGLSAVKMRIHRARSAFQQLIKRVCPDVWGGIRD
jgi:RNA polymerase sigma-70 factor, ECF subfamily